jgi:hypothetical protein
VLTLALVSRRRTSSGASTRRSSGAART